MKYHGNVQIYQHLDGMESIDVELSEEKTTAHKSEPFRALDIEGTTIFLTTAQALQIAAAITDKLASEVPTEKREAV